MEPVVSEKALAVYDSQQVVDRFLGDLHQGFDWLEALLSAIGSWPASKEDFNGCHYQYLVADEAFDWLLLAERLLASANGLVPEAEKERLLLHGLLPRVVTRQWFKERVGAAKYRALVNHCYGIRVEEALALSVEHDVRKQRHGLRAEEPGLEDAVYGHIYGLTKGELLHLFWKERGCSPLEVLSVRGHEEFTYWLFRYRLKRSDKARLASDTNKGISLLRGLGRPSSLTLLGLELASPPGAGLVEAVFEGNPQRA